MTKIKNNSGASKRFKPTAKGFKCKQSHRSHLLTSKSSKRKRQLRSPSYVDKADVVLVKRLLP